MPISTLSEKGQLTIPIEVRKALKIHPSDKIMITLEKNYAILAPIKGNILDLGGSVKISEKEKPVNFKEVRKEVLKKVVKRIEP